MKVCIVGCGPSGLTAIKRCNQYNLKCTAYEVTGEIGGVWVYTEKTDKDEFGLPILSSMYKSLRTNLPRELMEFSDFKFKYYTDTCYPSYTEVNRYFQEFADHFDLRRSIKLYHNVELIKRVENHWEVKVKNLLKNETAVYTFDAVVIANGHNSVPLIPEIKGIGTFRGKTLHSHYYRDPTPFRGKNVLIIGCGASGMDLVFEFHNITNMTFFSHRRPFLQQMKFPNNVIHKTEVSSIVGSQVYFVDNSSECIDVIIYCTGYKYSFPFLDKSCKVELKENRCVSPLYKGLINISEPSMCFLCLQRVTLIFLLIDLQALLFAKILVKDIELPSKEEMKQSLREEEQEQIRRNIPLKMFHCLGESYFHTVESYLRDLERFGKIKKPIPAVIFKLYNENRRCMLSDYMNLRRQKFKIIDDENFVKTLSDN